MNAAEIVRILLDASYGNRAVLVNRRGEHEFEIVLPDYPAWISYAGRRWGFGVAKKTGEHFYFEAPNDQGVPPKADIMPGGSLGTVGGTTGSGIAGLGPGN